MRHVLYFTGGREDNLTLVYGYHIGVILREWYKNYIWLKLFHLKKYLY